MRDIKFRGKDYRGMWVYGDLITQPIHHACVILEHGVINHSVDPQTVGQYTGLKDKNGKEIYEGDVVIWNDGRGETELNPKHGWIRKAVVKIDPSLNFELTKDTPSGSPFHKFHFGNFIYTDTENHLKIIGNIYENPDLITPSSVNESLNKLNG